MFRGTKRVPRGGAAITTLLVTALVAIGCGATASAAGGGGFPVPKCGWAPASLVQKTFGVNVRAIKGSWRTQIAPVLTCAYVERRPKLQFGFVPLVTVQYRELQHFRTTGLTYVRGLGSCVARSSCPQPHKSAWILVAHSKLTPAYPIAYPIYQIPYVSGVGLYVEDGLNALVIVVSNPDGPLPVKNEVGQVEQLARKLLPLFHWT